METALISAVGILAAAGCVWLLNRTPPLLPAAPGVTGDPPRDSEERQLRQYAGWFVHMRWVATLLSVVLIACSALFEFLPRETLFPLLLTVVALAASNLLFPGLAAGQLGVRTALTLQLYADLGFLILLLHLSGGIENPLYLLPVFNTLLAGIVLSRRQCFYLAWAGGVVCAAAVWGEWARLLPHYTLRVVPHGEHGEFHVAYDALYVGARTMLQLVMMLLTAHFVSRLAQHGRAHERGLAASAEEARAGRELLEQALDNTGTGLRVVDRQLRPLVANEQWRQWFPPESPADERLLAWTASDGGPPRLTMADSAVRRTELPVPLSESGGKARTFLVTTAPLHDREGRTDSVVELAQDITAEKEAQARMLAACKLAAVGEIAGKLAHEINNPIAIVSAKARILLSDRRAEMSEKVGRELARIVDLADRIAGIARGLLAYGRPSAAPRSPIDLREPVRRALSLVEEQAGRLGIRVADHLGDKPLTVHASGSEIEQVFLNLFLNALDVMPQGGVLGLSSAPAAIAGAAAAVVIVADSGPGVPEELRERIFEPFFTTKEEGHGSGLGLSVCQGIVRSHGGEIDVERGSGRGARFVVRLPAAPGEAAGAGRG